MLEVTAHVKNESTPYMERAFEPQSVKAIQADENIICDVVGTRFEKQAAIVKQEMRSYKAHIHPAPGNEYKAAVVESQSK